MDQTVVPPFRFVDPSKFGKQMMFRDHDFAPRVRSLVVPGIVQGGADRLVRPHSSLGVLVSYPAESIKAFELISKHNPYGMIWYGFGYGGELARYWANAFRKMWIAALTGRDSLALAMDEDFTFPHPVGSTDGDGNFPMGSFPHGGACFVHIGDMWFLCGASALEAVEDDAAAASAGKWTGAVLLAQASDPLAELRSLRNWPTARTTSPSPTPPRQHA